MSLDPSADGEATASRSRAVPAATRSSSRSSSTSRSASSKSSGSKSTGKGGSVAPRSTVFKRSRTSSGP